MVSDHGLGRSQGVGVDPETVNRESRMGGSLREANRRVSKPGAFPLSGKVQIVSRTLSGLFLGGALNRPRKRKRDESGKSPDHPRANRENPGKIGKVPKRTKKDKKEGRVQIGKPPRLKPPPAVKGVFK